MSNKDSLLIVDYYDSCGCTCNDGTCSPIYIDNLYYELMPNLRYNCGCMYDPTNSDTTYQLEKIALLALINRANGISLSVEDFFFNNPTPITPVTAFSANTSVVITANCCGDFVGSKTINYIRSDYARVFNNPTIVIGILNEVTIADLVPKLNTAFGTKLRIGDYIDAPLPVVDPNFPLKPLVVNIVADPNSYSYCGSVDLLLNNLKPQTLDYGVLRNYYILTDSTANPNIRQTVVSLDNEATPVSSFVFFNGATSIASVDVNQIYPTADGNVVLNGMFSFTSVIGETASATYLANTVTLNNIGAVVHQGPLAAFGGVKQHSVAQHYLIDAKYAVSPVNRIAKYTDSGDLDASFIPTGISYTPELVSLDQSGNIYCVSPVYTGPIPTDSSIIGPIRRIDRLLPTGGLDVIFNPVLITGIGNTQPLPITQLKVNDNGGFYCVFKNPLGQSSLAIQPIINGAVPATMPTTVDYAINPLYKFDDTGLWDRSFSNELFKNTATSILIPLINSATGDSILNIGSNTVNFFTYISNPVTGFNHRQPITFRADGSLATISGDDYQLSYRWLDATQLVSLSNGEFLSSGLAVLPNATGWDTPIPMVCKYDSKGAPMTIIYQSIIVSPLPPATISQVIVTEKHVV